MKRKNKCAGKKKFSTMGDALNMAAKQYKYFQTDVAVYECPSCLDFHLSTKYCNTQKYHKRWLNSLNREIDIEYNKMFGIVKSLRREIRLKRIEKEHEVKLQQKLEKQLPLSRQREILASLAKQSNPQSTSFWSWIRGIIE